MASDRPHSTPTWLHHTQLVADQVHWLEQPSSTNSALKELAKESLEEFGRPLPHGTVVATDTQIEGRGRLGRSWSSPPHLTLAASVLVRDFGTEPGELPLSWLPLLAGSAVTAALQPYARTAESVLAGVTTLRVGVKWPNDVHVRTEEDAQTDHPGLKICGVLCEALSDGSVIVGFGVNLVTPEWELPTERSTSLYALGALHDESVVLDDILPSLDSVGGRQLLDRVLAACVRELLALADLGCEHPQRAKTRVLRDSLTLGAQVRVHLPGGELVDGRATGLAADGSLIVDRPTTGQLIVSAADVEHLRAPADQL